MIIELPKNINGTENEYLQSQINSMKEQLNNYYSNTQNVVVGDLEITGTIKMGPNAVISWEDIKGTDDVASIEATNNAIEAMEKRISENMPDDYVPYTTKIGNTYVVSDALIAQNLQIEGGSISIFSGSMSDDIIALNYVNGSNRYTSYLRSGGLEIMYGYNGTEVASVGISYQEISMRGSGGATSEMTTSCIRTSGYIEAGGTLYGGALDVGGSVKGTSLQISGNASISGSLEALGSITGASLWLSNVASWDASPNAYIGASGRIWKGTGSTREIKKDIQAVTNEELDPKALYSLEVRQFKFKDGILSGADPRCGIDLIGLIAEEVAEIYPVAADIDENGKISNWNSRYMIPAMLKLIQEQNEKIKVLEEKLA